MAGGRRTLTIGADLKNARERRGFGLRELASLAGVSPEAVSSIERGSRYPSLQTLEALAAVLDVRIVIGPAETIVEYE